MSTSERYSDYDEFAWFYDRQWGHYARDVMPNLKHLVLDELPPAARILDLCCGTGQLAGMLHKLGFDVTGLDGSEQMIDIARRNARECEFIVDDARSFRQPSRYHAVLSTFDSLNHVMSLEQLERVFRNVFAALEAGGAFVFDLNMEAAYMARWNQSMGIAEEDHACVTVSGYDRDGKLADFRVTMFRLDEGEWKRTDVTLFQRCYTAAEITRTLVSVGFDEIRVVAADDENETHAFDESDGRAFFIGRKPRRATTA